RRGDLHAVGSAGLADAERAQDRRPGVEDLAALRPAQPDAVRRVRGPRPADARRRERLLRLEPEALGLRPLQLPRAAVPLAASMRIRCAPSGITARIGIAQAGQITW